MKYDKDYFIKKFEAIPDELWTEGELTDRENPDCHCVLGHCGVTTVKDEYVLTDEARALGDLLIPVSRVLYPSLMGKKGREDESDERRADACWSINDRYILEAKGEEAWREEINSGRNLPKLRVLQALKEIC